MIVLLNTAHSLEVAEKEIGLPVGQLMTPKGTRKDHGRQFGIDNGAFTHFDGKAFLSLLKGREAARERCLFVTVPDVVGSARRTREVFDHWHHKLAGWPLALVAQDGQEDLPIPWDMIAAIFIGGSTDWKRSDAAFQVGRAAKALGKWLHVGRVNTPARFDKWENTVDIDSIDGAGISQFSRMRKAFKLPTLFPRESKKTERRTGAKEGG